MNTRTLARIGLHTLAPACIAASLLIALPAEAGNSGRQAESRAQLPPTSGQNLAVAVDTSIRNIKVPARPEYLDDVAPPTTAARAANDDSKTRFGVDGRELPPEKLKVAWKLDFPMPGEVKLGNWRSAEAKAVGAVATFPLPRIIDRP